MKKLAVVVWLVLFSGVVFAEDYKTLFSNVTVEYKKFGQKFYIERVGHNIYDMYDAEQPNSCCDKMNFEIVTKEGTSIEGTYLRGKGIFIVDEPGFIMLTAKGLDSNTGKTFVTAHWRKLVFKEDIIENGRTAKTYFECESDMSDSDCEDRKDVVTIYGGDIYKLKKIK